MARASTVAPCRAARRASSSASGPASPPATTSVARARATTADAGGTWGATTRRTRRRRTSRTCRRRRRCCRRGGAPRCRRRRPPPRRGPRPRVPPRPAARRARSAAADTAHPRRVGVGVDIVVISVLESEEGVVVAAAGHEQLHLEAHQFVHQRRIDLAVARRPHPRRAVAVGVAACRGGKRHRHLVRVCGGVGGGGKCGEARALGVGRDEEELLARRAGCACSAPRDRAPML